MKLYKAIIVAVLALTVFDASATEIGKFTHRLVAGYHFGATAPIPIPREVREIKSYWPQFTPQIGYSISYQVGEKWSLESGITLDWKGMGVTDRVKYMYTDVIMDGNNIKGYFTGKNETTVKIAYVTVPLRVGYDITPSWKIRGGGFISYRNSSEFTGTVWDGYIRETGYDNLVNSPKILIPNKDEATFDFGKDMRDFDMGISLGFAHQLPRSRFGIYGDFTYSLTPIFPSKFTGIDFEMKNIYMAVGINYIF